MKEDMSAMHYEFLIRNAFNCDRFKKGADADIYRRLIGSEYYSNQKPLDIKLKKAYEKDLREVKKNLIKAFEHVIKKLENKTGTQNNIDELSNRIIEMNSANDVKAITSIIEFGQKNLKDFGIKMS